MASVTRRLARRAAVPRGSPLQLAPFLALSLRVFCRNLLAILLASTLVLSPWIALLAWIDTREITGWQLVVMDFGARFVSLFSSTLVSAVLARGLAAQLLGSTAGLGGDGESRWQAVARTVRTGLHCSVRIAVGFALMLLPGIFMTVRLFLAMPAVAIEGADATTAMQRSERLGRGSGWQLFAAWLFCLLGRIGVNWLLMQPALRLDGVLGDWLFVPIVVVFVGLEATLQIVAYVELRRSRENIEVAATAEVFD